MSDVELARRMGVKTWVVTFKRQRQRIPAYGGGEKSLVPWTGEEHRSLGTMLDAEVVAGRCSL